VTTFESTPTQIRRALLHNGYSPIPVNGKIPPFKKWEQKFQTNDQEIEQWSQTWPNATNTGVLTQRTPGLDIDITVPAAADAIEDLARETFGEHGDILLRFGNPPKRAILLKTEEPFKKLTRLFTAPNESEQKIEILADDQQVVVNGEHPEAHRPYYWRGTTPWETPREQLPYVRKADMVVFLDEAARVLVEEHGFVDKGRNASKPKDDGAEGVEANAPADRAELIAGIIAGEKVHDNQFRLAASLIGSGLSEIATVEVLQGLLLASKMERDSRWHDRWRQVHHDVRSGIEKFRHQSRDDSLPVFDPWERYIVPDFPLRVLPLAVQKYVTSQSVVIGCDPSALAMAALTAISGALDHRFAVKMMRSGNWWEHPRLWTLLVGDPSRKKTPVINDVTRPLERRQNDLRRDYEDIDRFHAFFVAELAPLGGKLVHPPRGRGLGVRLLLNPVRGSGRHSPRDQLRSRQGQPGGRRDVAAQGAPRRRARSGVIAATSQARPHTQGAQPMSALGLRDRCGRSGLPVHVRFAPKAKDVLRCRE
jgi:hypothetical protein